MRTDGEVASPTQDSQGVASQEQEPLTYSHAVERLRGFGLTASPCTSEIVRLRDLLVKVVQTNLLGEREAIEIMKALHKEWERDAPCYRDSRVEVNVDEFHSSPTAQLDMLQRIRNTEELMPEHRVHLVLVGSAPEEFAAILRECRLRCFTIECISRAAAMEAVPA